MPVEVKSWEDYQKTIEGLLEAEKKLSEQVSVLSAILVEVYETVLRQTSYKPETRHLVEGAIYKNQPEAFSAREDYDSVIDIYDEFAEKVKCGKKPTRGF